MYLDACNASFETALSRLPRIRTFLNAINDVPHPEEHCRHKPEARLEGRRLLMRRIVLWLLVAVLVPILGGCVPQEQIGGRLLHSNVIIVREFTAPGSAITLDPSFGFS